MENDMSIIKFVVIGKDECGEDFHAGEFRCPRCYYDDDDEYNVIWEFLVFNAETKARERYPEARYFWVEREISSMSYGELMAYGSAMGWI